MLSLKGCKMCVNYVHLLVHIQIVFSHMLAPTFVYYYFAIVIAQQ